MTEETTEVDAMIGMKIALAIEVSRYYFLEILFLFIVQLN